MDKNSRNLLSQVWLASSPNLGYKAKHRILDHYGGAEQAFDRFDPHARSLAGDKAYQELAKIRLMGLDKIAAALKRIEASVCIAGDESFPDILRDIPDPPDLLFYQGVLNRDFGRAVAIVGSRRETRYGREQAHKIARELSENGIKVVSGLARGIDTAAHLGALEGGGHTVAVLGSGINNIYPTENKELAARIIASGGAVISEFAPNADPFAFHFPFRNRLVSGLCQATLLVEAREKSGTLITVGHALSQGREVFALPGPVDAPGSVVPHRMLREGAGLVTCARDLMEDMGWTVRELAEQTQFPLPDLTNDQRRLYDALCVEPLDFNELQALLDLSTQELNVLLTTLEMHGLIQTLPGRTFKATHN